MFGAYIALAPNTQSIVRGWDGQEGQPNTPNWPRRVFVLLPKAHQTPTPINIRLLVRRGAGERAEKNSNIKWSVICTLNH